MLSIDKINKLQQENEAYKQSEQEAQEIIAELKAENEKLKRIIDNVKDYCILTRNEFCESHCLSYNLTRAEEE